MGMQPVQRSPFMLADKQTINSGNAAGVGRNAQVTFNPVLQENPQRGPYWLDEIRFYADGSAFQQLCYSELLQARIMVGRYLLTHDFVPLRLLAPRFNQLPGQIASALLHTNASPDSSTVFRLDKPMWVAQTDLVSIELRLDPNIVTTALLSNLGVTSFAFDVFAALICRSIASGTKRPKKMSIPYVAYWNSGLLPLGVKYQLRSTENDLKNPYAEPLRVTGLSGYLNFDFDDCNVPSANYNSVHGATGWQMGALLNRDAVLRMHDSKGAMLIRDLTPFGQVFHTRHGFWDFSCTMPPKSFYIVAPQIDLRDYVSQYATAVSPYMAIGLVGYHDVLLQGSMPPGDMG